MKEIYLEFLAFSLPIILTCLITPNWICLPLFLLGLAIIPFQRYTLIQKTYFKQISKIIKPSNYELISGFRKNFIYLIPLYGMSLILCWTPYVSIFLLWIITTQISSFYYECESLEILKATNQTTRSLVSNKMFQHSKIMILLYLPVVILNTIFHPELWEINLLFIPAQVTYLCFCICYKYSIYEPNKSSILENITQALISFTILIPYLLPIPLFMATTYYSQAQKNLKNYLND